MSHVIGQNFGYFLKKCLPSKLHYRTELGKDIKQIWVLLFNVLVPLFFFPRNCSRPTRHVPQMPVILLKGKHGKMLS